MEAIQSEHDLQYQLKRYLPPRILEKNIAPTHLEARSIEYLQKKDHNFKDNILAEYEETLANPFPKGPWPFQMKVCGWVAFTMDDESAARIKFAKPEEEDASCPYSLDLCMDKPELAFSGHMEQVYVETVKGRKQIVYSQWPYKISTKEWYEKMYMPYHKNWKELSYQRGQLIKEDQRARLDDVELVSLDHLDVLASAASKHGGHYQKPRSRLIMVCFFFVFFLRCAQCPMQKDYERMAAKVDASLVIWSDSDDLMEPEPDADSKGSAEKKTGSAEKKTLGKGAGVEKKPRKKVVKRPRRKADNNSPKKKKYRRGVPKRNAKRQARGKARGKGARVKKRKRTKWVRGAPASPDEKPVEKPSAEVRQSLDDEATLIKLR